MNGAMMASDLKFIETSDNIILQWKDDIYSSPIKKVPGESAAEVFEKFVKSASSDAALKELFPDQFSFDFDLTLDAWKETILVERRDPFETEGLSKEEARWAWSLLEQWEEIEPESKGEFMDLMFQAKETLEGLGIDLYLSEESRDKILTLFDPKCMMMFEYAPSKGIVNFYQDVWKKLKN